MDWWRQSDQESRVLFTNSVSGTKSKKLQHGHEGPFFPSKRSQILLLHTHIFSWTFSRGQKNRAEELAQTSVWFPLFLFPGCVLDVKLPHSRRDSVSDEFLFWNEMGQKAFKTPKEIWCMMPEAWLSHLLKGKCAPNHLTRNVAHKDVLLQPNCCPSPPNYPHQKVPSHTHTRVCFTISGSTVYRLVTSSEWRGVRPTPVVRFC